MTARTKKQLALKSDKRAGASKNALPPAGGTKRSIDAQVREALSWLEQHGTKHTLEGMARYGIPSDNALGVSVSDIQVLAKRLGRNHELAAGLWETRCYEARMLCSFVDEPARVTPAQMDRWCRDFDNWAICDTLCFHLFDRTPHAWSKIEKWSGSGDEFVKRAAFALLASLALHDRTTPDPPFARSLTFIERGATDERNFVKKGVSWALRGVGRRSAGLHAASMALAKRLAVSSHAAARWVGKDALRDLTKPAVTRRFAATSRGASA
jgi:3-methyladenine DNA glycosylase AlkD